MKLQKVLAISACALAGLVTQSASAREFADIYTQCGLGAMIAPNNEAVAAITNVTWDLGSTAISSDASSPENCKGGAAKKAAFIHEAYPQLAVDLARGHGAHLQTLLALSECRVEARSEVVRAVRADFAQTLATPGYAVLTRAQQAEQMYTAVNRRLAQDFAATCSQT